MKVLITGATGLIGKEIVKQCHAKQIYVHYLTTSKHKLSTQDNYKGFYWNPDKNQIDVTCFNGVDTIINLAGAPISKRWTNNYKHTIIESRTHALKLLKDTIVKENVEIKHLISASAIGIYPSSLVNYYDETFTEASSTFLGKVVQQWEAALDEFTSLGIKVAKIRIGLVLDRNEGALPQIVKPIRFCAGAAFGSGDQWQSWIHVKDLARLFVFIIAHDLQGVFNGVAPNAVTNTEFTKTVAKTLKRPLMLPNIPEFAMKLALGEMHILLFESQRVSSKKVEDLGFHFTYHHLEPALQDILQH
jgi:uncharacterized protein (TIGR01777 family)